MAQCSSKCCKLKAETFVKDGSMYLLGYVRCNHCEVYLEKKDCNKTRNGKLLCPCCKSQCRYSPRNKNQGRMV